MLLRRAKLNDLETIASVHRAAFFHAMPHMPVLHSPEEDLVYFAAVVFVESEVWLIEKAGAVAGFIAFRPGWVDHLYIRPEHQGCGLGSALLARAQESAAILRLWTFQCNRRACRFYEKHGFQIELETDGAANQERQPDFLYLWQRVGGRDDQITHSEK